MNRTIISLTILAVVAASSGAQGHGHCGGHHGHHGGMHHAGGHHGGGSHHYRGGYGYSVGAPFQMGVPFQPAFNPGQFWLQTAQAAVQCEQARRLYIENRVLVDQYLHERKVPQTRRFV